MENKSCGKCHFFDVPEIPVRGPGRRCNASMPKPDAGKKRTIFVLPHEGKDCPCFTPPKQERNDQ